MASEQIMNEAIAKAVAETPRVAILAMVDVWAERMHDISGTMIGSPAIKQPTFH